MDGLRAMREARYAENAARAKTAAPTAKQPTAKQAATKTSAAASTAPPAESADSDLCGHRAISGRTCTREKGHAAKSHRYA